MKIQSFLKCLKGGREVLLQKSRTKFSYIFKWNISPCSLCSCRVGRAQEVTGDTLTELYISYNIIEKMKGVNALKKLKVCVCV